MLIWLFSGVLLVPATRVDATCTYCCMHLLGSTTASPTTMYSMSCELPTLCVNWVLQQQAHQRNPLLYTRYYWRHTPRGGKNKKTAVPPKTTQTPTTIHGVSNRHGGARPCSQPSRACPGRAPPSRVLEPYEKLKTFTRGQAVTQESMQAFVAGIEGLPEEAKASLKASTPASYVGNAAAQARALGGHLQVLLK